MPLDYAGESTDPLLPALQIITRLFMYLGILRLAASLCLAVYVSLFNVSINFLNGWIYLVQGVVAILQIIACAKNVRRPETIRLIWAWIWLDIAFQIFSTSFSLYGVIFQATIQRPGQPIRLAAMIAYRVLQMPLGCSLALLMMILLISRKRLVAAAAK
jgi:hypothetical protein